MSVFRVTVLIAATGPKGTAVARELADGVFSVITPHREAASFSWCALLSFGTVIDDGEDLASPRVAAALGPGAAVLYHAAYTQGGTEAIDSLPGGRAWRESVEAVPETSRHLTVHIGHLVEPNERDRGHVQDLMQLAGRISLTGSAGEVAAKLGPSPPPVSPRLPTSRPGQTSPANCGLSPRQPAFPPAERSELTVAHPDPGCLKEQSAQVPSIL